jgi:predicted nucleic acid-binding Zn ribbon protein
MIALYCINCGKELEKCQKKYCSFKCLGIVLYKESLDKYYSNPNYCLYCKKIIEVKENEKPYIARHKKFCNQGCSATFNNRKRIKNNRYCLNCNKELKHYNTTYCSHECHNIYYKNLRIKQWLDGKWDGMDGKKFKILSKIIRNYILEKQEYKCNECENNKWFGEDIPLEIHHKDGNWMNNSPENVEGLCSNCHDIKNRQISFTNKPPETYRTKSRENRSKEGNGYLRG